MDGSYSQESDSSREDKEQKGSRGKSQKAQGDLLTTEEKKANHIASEKKRRAAIREGFDKITAIVPGLEPNQGRSEAIVLTKTVEFLTQLLEENHALNQLAARYNVSLDDADGE
ncbi:hypothetical protein TRVA0_005S02322 [Trichomonascus vanleenenianus]|uniref:uncharacterized protein n=1 Tax=Trichomonascus vanleenenianus TaxID=2268995 RepID=UPI003ECAE79A